MLYGELAYLGFGLAARPEKPLRPVAEVLADAMNQFGSDHRILSIFGAWSQEISSIPGIVSAIEIALKNCSDEAAALVKKQAEGRDGLDFLVRAVNARSPSRALLNAYENAPRVAAADKRKLRDPEKFLVRLRSVPH